MDYTFGVAPDPYTPKRELVGGWSTLYQSNDGSLFDADPVSENEFGFAFDPTNSNVLYTATQVNGVYKSTDGGETWTASNGSLTPWATANGNFIDVRSIFVDPSNPQSLYIGTNGDGVYKSTDGAASWTSVLAPTEAIGCLLVVPGSPSAVYACVNGSGIQRSSDGGATWTDASQGLPSLDANGLAVDGATGDLYATVGPGAYVKRGTQAWVGIDPACMPGHAAGSPAIVANANARQLVVAAAGGVYAHAL